MSISKQCNSKVFPCPAGTRCPEHKLLWELTKRQDFSGLIKYAEQSHLKLPPTFLPNQLPERLTPEAESLRNGIFLSSSRTYGETYIEPVIRHILGLSKATSNDHDGYDPNSGEKYEIKSSKVLLAPPRKPKKASLLDTILAKAETNPLSRIVRYENRTTERYDANIQNVKRDHFDYLVYNLLYQEGIEIYKIRKEEINKTHISNWSDKHGRYDEEGKSGQFNIKCGNIENHNRYSLGFFSWDELVKYYRDLNE